MLGTLLLNVVNTWVVIMTGHVWSVPHVMEVVVLDAVLGRTTKYGKPLTLMGATVDKPVLMHTVDESLTTEAHNGKFRAIVVVVPEAGVFYCHRERRKVCVGVPNSLVPRDINWRRLPKNGCASKRFAANGYITRLWGGNADCVWKWKIHCQSPALNIPAALPRVPLSICSLESSRGIAVYHLRQCADEDSPRLPPDFIAAADLSSTHTVEELRRAYLMGYVQSPSARRGCRHYVKQHLHRVIDLETVLVIDADVSVDLSNASHYDVNDASQSFSIWTEDFPNTTLNWYLVLPNVYGTKSHNGRNYNGVAIKLTHGTLISWDGRLIRHCTSVMQRREGRSCLRHVLWCQVCSGALWRPPCNDF